MNKEACLEACAHLNFLTYIIHENVKAKGFWKVVNDGEKIALMHSELSEALEALREGNPKDLKLPKFDNLDIELADTIIRILDYCGHKGINIGEAVFAKIEYNETRQYKHAKEF